jgi:hypothetical protein
VESVLDAALDVVYSHEEQQRRLSDEGILQVRDAAMLATCVGHVGLTVRISAVRTIKAPCFSEEACTTQGCCARGCKGNRLLLQVEEEDEAAGLPIETFLLDTPHHKNSSRGVAMPQVPITSNKLCRLLYTWLEVGRPSLVGHAKNRDSTYTDPKTLFITNRGMAFQELSKWYKLLHIKYKAPYPIITLQAYRSVFVTDRLEDPDRPGPDNEGAATIMGNSVAQWEASYYKNKRIKLAQKATRAMGSYRASHLKEAGYLQDEEEEEEEMEQAQ